MINSRPVLGKLKISTPNSDRGQFLPHFHPRFSILGDIPILIPAFPSQVGEKFLSPLGSNQWLQWT